jgi:hypothetical protein
MALTPPSKLETGLAGVPPLFPLAPKFGVLIVKGFTFIGSCKSPFPPALAAFPDDDPTSSILGY